MWNFFISMNVQRDMEVPKLNEGEKQTLEW